MSFSLKNTHRQHEEAPKRMLSCQIASSHSMQNQIEYRSRCSRGLRGPFDKATLNREVRLVKF